MGGERHSSSCVYLKKIEITLVLLTPPVHPPEPVHPEQSPMGYTLEQKPPKSNFKQKYCLLSTNKYTNASHPLKRWESFPSNQFEKVKNTTLASII